MKIGDKVKVINSSYLYPSYPTMFRALKFENIEENKLPKDNKVRVWVIKAIEPHRSGNGNIVVHITSGGHEVLMDLRGIKKLKSGEIDTLSAAETNNAIQYYLTKGYVFKDNQLVKLTLKDVYCFAPTVEDKLEVYNRCKDRLSSAANFCSNRNIIRIINNTAEVLNFGIISDGRTELSIENFIALVKKHIN